MSSLSFIPSNVVSTNQDLTEPNYKSTSHSSLATEVKTTHVADSIHDIKLYASELNNRYRTMEKLALRARKYAEERNRSQEIKTLEALEKVSSAQNEEEISIKEIDSIREREYTRAIIEKINAEHARNLAAKVEALALDLSLAAKRANIVRLIDLLD